MSGFDQYGLRTRGVPACGLATGHKQLAVLPTNRHGLHVSRQANLLIAGQFPEISGGAGHTELRRGLRYVQPQDRQNSSLNVSPGCGDYAFWLMSYSSSDNGCR
jgi:hypothetical protein